MALEIITNNGYKYIRVVEIKNNDYETHLKVAQLLQKNEKKD